MHTAEAQDLIGTLDCTLNWGFIMDYVVAITCTYPGSIRVRTSKMQSNSKWGIVRLGSLQRFDPPMDRTVQLARYQRLVWSIYILHPGRF
jgi:hypothetical protein